MSDSPREWSWCARETWAIAQPIPEAEYLPFFENSLELVVCEGLGLRWSLKAWIGF